MATANVSLCNGLQGSASCGVISRMQSLLQHEPQTITCKLVRKILWTQPQCPCSYENSSLLIVATSPILSISTQLQRAYFLKTHDGSQPTLLNRFCWSEPFELGQLDYDYWARPVEIGLLHADCWAEKAERRLLNWTCWWDCRGWIGTVEVELLNWDCWTRLLNWTCWTGTLNLRLLEVV